MRGGPARWKEERSIDEDNRQLAAKGESPRNMEKREVHTYTHSYPIWWHTCMDECNEYVYMYI